MTRGERKPYEVPRLTVHGPVERLPQTPVGGKKLEKHPFKLGSRIRPQ